MLSAQVGLLLCDARNRAHIGSLAHLVCLSPLSCDIKQKRRYGPTLQMWKARCREVSNVLCQSGNQCSIREAESIGNADIFIYTGDTYVYTHTCIDR